jgi:hypothetical protein
MYNFDFVQNKMQIAILLLTLIRILIQLFTLMWFGIRLSKTRLIQADPDLVLDPQHCYIQAGFDPSIQRHSGIEGRQMTQCEITYINRKNPNKSPFLTNRQTSYLRSYDDLKRSKKLDRYVISMEDISGRLLKEYR